MLSLETFVQQPAGNEQHILKFLAGDDTLKPLAWVFKGFQVYYTVHCSQSDSPSEILAECGLASGSIDTTAYCASATDAVGWTLQRFHTAVSLDIQMFQSPALPAFPKLHLNLIGPKKEIKRMNVEIIRPLYDSIRKGQVKNKHTTLIGKADNALNLQYYCFKLANYLISPS